MSNCGFESFGDIKFGVVTGYFDCSFNKLRSLEGSPRKVEGYFNCSFNNLTSLNYAPEYVGSTYHCERNQLTTLKGAPKYVKGSFFCHFNKLTTLENAPQEVEGDFICSNNKLISSLRGAPARIGGSFRCDNNQLTTLEGAPKYLEGNFSCDYNQLITLEGAPEFVKGSFSCNNNKLIALEDIPRKVGGIFYCENNQLTTLGDIKSRVVKKVIAKGNPLLKKNKDLQESREDEFGEVDEFEEPLQAKRGTRHPVDLRRGTTFTSIIHDYISDLKRMDPELSNEELIEKIIEEFSESEVLLERSIAIDILSEYYELHSSHNEDATEGDLEDEAYNLIYGESKSYKDVVEFLAKKYGYTPHEVKMIIGEYEDYTYTFDAGDYEEYSENKSSNFSEMIGPKDQGGQSAPVPYSKPPVPYDTASTAFDKSEEVPSATQAEIKDITIEKPEIKDFFDAMSKIDPKDLQQLTQGILTEKTDSRGLQEAKKDDIGDVSEFEQPDYWGGRVLEIMRKRGIKYTINPKTGICNVDGTVNISNSGLESFGNIKFGVVKGSFDCGENELTSLKGSPDFVRGSFSCTSNQITTLKGAPKYVGGNFFCHNNNRLTTLEGAPEHIGGQLYRDPILFDKSRVKEKYIQTQDPLKINLKHYKKIL